MGFRDEFIAKAQQKALEFMENNPEKAQTVLETAGKLQEVVADAKAGKPVDYQAVAADVKNAVKSLFGPKQ